MATHNHQRSRKPLRGAAPCPGLLLHIGCAILIFLLPALMGCSNRTTPPAQNSPVDLAERAVQSSPSDINLRRALAQQYEASGETFGAIQQFAIVITMQGSNEADTLHLAELYGKSGEFERSAETLQNYLNAHPGSKETRLQLGLYRFKLGFFDDAANAIRPLLPNWKALTPDEQTAILQYLTFAGDTRAVEKISPRQDGRFSAVHALALVIDHKNTAAKNLILRHLDSHPEDVDSVYLLGLALLQDGKPRPALAVFNKLTTLSNAPARARFHAARLLAENHNSKKAQDLLRALDEQASHDAAEDPFYWKAWSQISKLETGKSREILMGINGGYLAFYSGDPVGAETTWRQTIPLASDEDRHEIYAAIYNSAFRRHDTDTALSITSDALKFRPNDPYFLKRRAEILLGQNRLKEALETAQTLQKVVPPAQEAEVVELLCRIALDSGNPTLLSEQANRLRQLLPKDPSTPLHLAEWETQQGKAAQNLENLLKLYQEAIDKAPDNAEARTYAGMTLADLNRDTEAVRSILHGLTLSPRVLDGAANARLAGVYQKRGMDAERRFQLQRYAILQKSKVGWPALLKALRQDRPFDEWLALGNAALERRENWIALTAFNRCVRLSPTNRTAWMLLAATNKRLGRLDETIDAIQHARSLKP